jgi:hypothetical protein
MPQVALVFPMFFRAEGRSVREIELGSLFALGSAAILVLLGIERCRIMASVH